MNRKLITALDDGLKNKVNWHDIAFTYFNRISSAVEVAILGRILRVEFVMSSYILVCAVVITIFSIVEIIQSALGETQ